MPTPAPTPALPADKDTYAATDKVIRQTDCQYGFGKEAVTLNLKFLGDTAQAVGLAASFRTGTRVKLTDVKSKFGELSGLDASAIEASGKVTASTAATKQGSGAATIAVQFPYKGKVSIAGGGDAPEERKVVVWSEKSTDYEFPLEIYAGEGESATDVNAGDLEAWKQEKTRDIGNYRNFCYTPPDGGTPVELEGHTLELAKKIYKGIESVKRAYPEVIRVSYYYNYKADKDEVDATLLGQIDETPDLYYIDSTPDSVWSDKFDGFSWLKVSFDVDPQPTEYDSYWNMTVTETWIGIDTNEKGEWDEDLYGADGTRWKFATAEEGE